MKTVSKQNQLIKLAQETNNDSITFKISDEFNYIDNDKNQIPSEKNYNLNYQKNYIIFNFSRVLLEYQYYKANFFKEDKSFELFSSSLIFSSKLATCLFEKPENHKSQEFKIWQQLLNNQKNLNKNFLQKLSYDDFFFLEEHFVNYLELHMSMLYLNWFSQTIELKFDPLLLIVKDCDKKKTVDLKTGVLAVELFNHFCKYCNQEFGLSSYPTKKKHRGATIYLMNKLLNSSSVKIIEKRVEKGYILILKTSTKR